MGKYTALLAALLLVLLLPVSSTAEAKVVDVSHMVEGTGLVSAHFVEKPPLWDALVMLWAPLRVSINCSTSAYIVLTAGSVQDLQSDAATKVVWCGWQNIMSEPNVCRLQFSPMHATYFAVKPLQAGLLSFGAPELACEVVATAGSLQGDLAWRAASAITAFLVFRQAGDLAKSQVFRLTSGGVLGVTGCAVIVLLIVARNAPAKRAIGAAFAVSASGMLAVVRWLYGTWAPGLQEVLLSRAGLWYIIVTATAGVAVTYWLDDTSNQKINTSIRVALQGVALATVYFSIADERWAVAAVLLILTHRWLLAILRRLYRLGGAVTRLARRQLRQSLGEPRAGLLALPDDWEEASYHSSQDSDYDPDAQSEEESEEGIHTEHDSDKDDDDGRQQQPAFNAPRQVGPYGSPWGQQAAHQAAADGVSAHTAGGRRDGEMLSAPSFDNWARQSAQERRTAAAAQASLAGSKAAGNAGEGPRAPAPPAGGWSAPLVAVDRIQGTHTYQQQVSPPEQRPSSSSPWSEKKVVDLTQPKPTSPSAAGGVGASTGAGGGMGAAAAAPGMSPSAQRIINPETGRHIAVGGSKFQDLVGRGYVPDYVTGVLVLAPGAQPSAAPAAGGAGNRGAPSPAAAAGLRVRKSKAQADM